jgi:hypothetical protein
MDEIYSIHVNEETVVINGELTIEEAFDFINFFEKKGFKNISNGYDSALHMTKKTEQEITEQEESSDSFWQILYEQLKERHLKTMKRNEELESLVTKVVRQDRPFELSTSGGKNE